MAAIGQLEPLKPGTGQMVLPDAAPIAAPTE
jgi:hypothetical protein